MPVAPKQTAFAVCSGLSAFVADLQSRYLRTPFHQLRKVFERAALFRFGVVFEQTLDHLGCRRLDLAGVNKAARAVNRKVIAPRKNVAIHGKRFGVIIHCTQPRRTRNLAI